MEANERRTAMRQFIVIENTLGYLPEEDDPFITEDYSAAVAYMNERVHEYADSLTEGQGKPVIEWGLASAGNYAAAAVSDESREHDLGRWFSVELCEEDA
jgi:hypothetical protein